MCSPWGHDWATEVNWDICLWNKLHNYTWLSPFNVFRNLKCWYCSHTLKSWKISNNDHPWGGGDWWEGNEGCCCCCCCVASVVSDSVPSYGQQSTRLRRSWDSPGKNTGVGCHFLLQCMKVKSESEVAQSCPTLSDCMDCSLPGSSVHGIFQARVLEWGAIVDNILFCNVGIYFNEHDCFHNFNSNKIWKIETASFKAM